ncbi:SAM-dependent methyltransferase, PUA domain-containing [Desulfuromonas sp. DDH964]|uniref:class I SAM-dependent methyltransferase n=1 Tax=Desulfuromonas sp. DDH964 TaxID=1823759 RepID=UPI00078D5638|nr:class I SAM-dependent methyltransferase [Desulfuromonas sp. DDH964]AMV73665.1 SAM-dependent methyltransferase, PUA domain-containing [Desulfuromonas sp. DDH964]
MLETIFTRSAAILAAPTGAARRILHGRGQTYPGLEHVTLDWYPPLLLLVLYREPEPDWLAALAVGLRELAAGSACCLLVQYRCRPGTPTHCLWGEEPGTLDAVEAGLRFRIHPSKAQNIGFFPDMAVGRKLVRQVARERRVLNLFAYTCSFSVAALAGGAREVVNLDMHRRSLDIGRLNHQLNGLDLRQAHFLPHDLFKSFGKLRRLGPFDLVIVDPPGPQGQSFQPQRDWPKLLGRLDQLLAPGGEVIAALSAPGPGPGFLRAELARQAPQLELLNQLRAGDDFPESDPERGLTLFHLRRA